MNGSLKMFYSFIFRFTVIYTIAFILSFPFPYHILPNIGRQISLFFEPINEWWITLFSLKNVTPDILSDSTGLYTHLISLSIIAVIGSSIWWWITKYKPQKQWPYWFYTGIAYYLSLTLLIYGFNKIFKWQFFFPEPNTLFTPLGQLTPDILFWSAIGSSYSYSFFSGIIEVIPALLLLHKKTRLLGSLVALMVLINVTMLNFSFDISVKIYSLFLLLLTVILIQPNWRSLLNYFLNTKNASQIYIDNSIVVLKRKRFIILKPITVGLVFFEVLFPYFQSQNFNDDLTKKLPYHGAYSIVSTTSNLNPSELPKRVFIHRRGYIIFQYDDETMASFNLNYNADTLFVRQDDAKNQFHFFSVQYLSDTLYLSGLIKTQPVFLKSTPINLSTLPIKRDHFHWTIDTY